MRPRTFTADAPLPCLGVQTITDLSAAVALTIPAGAVYAAVQALGQPVRWWPDGTAPTASTGHKLPADSTLWLTSSLAAFRAIEQSAGASLAISYYGAP